MLKTVLVVGGSGFLGQHTVRRLVDGRCAVWATIGLEKIPPAIGGARWIPTDLTNPECAKDWPGRCDYVVYLAQARSWRRFPDTADEIFAINLTSLQQTLSYARRAGVRSLIFASSGSVYTNQSQPANEDDKIDLSSSRSYYAATKVSSEALLSAYGGAFSVAQLRIFMPYGQGQSAEMLLPMLVKRVHDGQPITLQGADGLRANPVAAADVAEAFARCLDLENQATMNLAGPDVLTLRQIGEIIGNVVQREPVFEVQPDAIAPMIVGNTMRMREILDWTPSSGFEAGITQWLRPNVSSRAA